MFEEFSGSYYLGRMYVQPSDVDRARMHRNQHEQLNEVLYVEDEGVERLDAPLVFKLDNAHFPVHGDDTVPADTLAVPDEMIDDDHERGPALREVFLAKADRARQLLRLAGDYRPPDVT